jgi:thermopsin
MNSRRAARWLALGVTVLMTVAPLGLAGAPASPLNPAHDGSNAVAAPFGSSAPRAAPAGSHVASLASGPGAQAPIAAPPAPLASTPGATGPSETVARLLSSLNARGVSDHDVFLPDFAGEVHTAPTDGHIAPTYTTSPAPYGIGDFGLRNVSGTLTPYTTDTTSLNGSFSTDLLTGYSGDVSGPDEYGVQLNAVLNDVTLFGTTGYQFWTQNVFEFSPSNQTIQFVSNIWNFSGGALDCNAFYRAGGTCVQPDYYYGLSVPVPATWPYSVRLWMNSTLSGGRDEVLFNYTVSSADGNFAGEFDYAIFNSTRAGEGPLTSPAQYVANGHTYDPIGLPDDFEITLGGPGGGSNFDLFDSEATYLTLAYYNETTHQYENVDSAYNVGGETGETSYGVNAAWARFAGCADCVALNNGPSFSYGLWNVSGAPQETAPYATAASCVIDPAPMTAFVFVAPGTGVTNLSDFQWAPDNLFGSHALVLPEGDYTLDVVAANFDPASVNIDVLPGCRSTPSLTADTSTGVYTPLWALNETALASISSGLDGYGNYALFTNQYANLGDIPCASNYGCANFPWFGVFNDYFFPVFSGIFLNSTIGVDIISPPSFQVNFPPGPTFQRLVTYFGTPDSNDLQLVFYDDSDINLGEGTIGGWWFSLSFFGPAQSAASVQFWNTTYSYVFDNTFDVGGIGLFLYGGSTNEIYNNSFYTFAPPAPNGDSITSLYWGSIGLVDTDWGYASTYGGPNDGACYAADACDLIWNNLFDTWVTATQLYTDPYTGTAPIGEFSQAYNTAYEGNATNIIGGDYLGGNYWWDYGYAANPYNVLPYAGINSLPYLEGFQPWPAYLCETQLTLCDGGGGDWYPLTFFPVFAVNFTETGLPAGQVWGVGSFVGEELGGTAYVLESGEVENLSNSSSIPSWTNLSFAAGEYGYYAFTASGLYAAPAGTVTVTDASVTVVIHFLAAVTLTFRETGLPGSTTWYAYANSGGTYWEISGQGDSLAIPGLLPGAIGWSVDASVAGWTPVPPSGIATLTTNGTVSVTFVALLTLSVHETGLASGTEWSFAYASTTGGYFGTWATTGEWLNVSLPAIDFNWSVEAAGYLATPAVGSLAFTAAETLSVAFSPASGMGTLTGTVSPASASLSVDGTREPLGSGGSFSMTLPVGVHSVEVTDPGYAPYFNNVTVTSGSTAHLAIALVATAASGVAGIDTLGWLLIVILAALAAVFLVTTLVVARRGPRPPPPMPTYDPSPAPAAPAAVGSPPWEESPPPPPPPGS